MKLNRKQDINLLHKVCILQANRKNKIAALASEWLRHFQLLLWNHWTIFNENLTGIKILTSSTKFAGRSEKQYGRPGFWLAETFFTSPLKPLNGISTKLDRKQGVNFLYLVCVFRAIWKTKMAALAYDWLRHFRLFLCNHWTEFNKT